MRTARSTVVIVAGALLLAGCASEAQPPPPEPPPDPATTSEPAAGTESRNTGSDDESTEPAPDDDVPDRPVMDPPPRPEAMDDDGIAGAEAAAKYFINLYPYVYATGDLTEWKTLSDPECVFCTSVIENVEELHRKDGYRVGAEIKVMNVDALPPQQGHGYFGVMMSVSEGPSTRYPEAGADPVNKDGSEYELTFALGRQDIEWSIREVQIEAPSSDTSGR